jgi:MoxR-like ATPase
VSAPPTTAELSHAGRVVKSVADAFASRIIGQDQLRWSLLIALVAGGHVLIESVPGLAKTTAVKTLASAFDASFARVQCTPDLMPSDIVGTQIYDYQQGAFHTEIGPINANLVLVDEVNRANAKTQSALLEAMQEHQITIAGERFALPRPFLVMATQNPIEQEGTYELPEAQVDRFLLKEVMTYPDLSQEVAIMERIEQTDFDDGSGLRTGHGAADIVTLQALAKRVYVDRAVKDYIARVVTATRHPAQVIPPDLARHVEFGASPRASIAFLTAGKALALLTGRNHVLPEDVTYLAHKVLRHRIILTYEAQARGVKTEQIIDAVFAATRTP